MAGHEFPGCTEDEFDEAALEGRHPPVADQSTQSRSHNTSANTQRNRQAPKDRRPYNSNSQCKHQMRRFFMATSEEISLSQDEDVNQKGD